MAINGGMFQDGSRGLIMQPTTETMKLQTNTITMMDGRVPMDVGAVEGEGDGSEEMVLSSRPHNNCRKIDR